MLRASDSVLEFLLMTGGHERENVHWRGTLGNLAARFGATGEATVRQVRIDGKRQWRHAANIRENAAIRSGLYTMTHPRRWLGRSNSS